MNNTVRLFKLFNLMKKHPDLEILLMVGSEFADESFQYWPGSIGDITIDWVWFNEEHIIIGDDIEEEIEDAVYDYIENLDEENIKKTIDNKIKKLKEESNIKKMIILYIEL